MIIDFSVQNFKGIKDRITLSFEPEKSENLQEYYIVEPLPGLKLLKIGIIYGPNGSGKTTILTALDFFRSLVSSGASQKQESIKFKPFLFDNLTPEQDTHFELNFVHSAFRYRYLISFNQQSVTSEELYTFAPKKSLIYSRSTDSEKQLAKISFGSKIRLKKSAEEALEANTLWNSTVLNGYLKTNMDFPELQNVSEWFKNILSKKIDPDNDLSYQVKAQILENTIDKGSVLRFMQKADFRIQDITVSKEKRPTPSALKEFLEMINRQSAQENPEFQLRPTDTIEDLKLTFNHRVVIDERSHDFPLSYEDESEGTKRYFQFSGLLALMLSGDKIYLIDELEASLHPDLLKHFLLLFLVNVKTSQLIATTHYRELLLEKDMLRNDAVWFTEKKIDGSCELFSLSDFDSSVVRDTTSVFNAYRSGKLGAAPILSDYYIEQRKNER